MYELQHQRLRKFDRKNGQTSKEESVAQAGIRDHHYWTENWVKFICVVSEKDC